MKDEGNRERGEWKRKRRRRAMERREDRPIDGLRFARVSLVRRLREGGLSARRITDGILRRETPSQRPAALHP